MVKISLYKYYEHLILLIAFLYILVPMGLLSSLKSILFIILMLAFLFRTKLKLHKIYIFITLVFLVIMLMQVLNAYRNNFFEVEIFLELKSFIGFFFTASIVTYSLNSKYIDAKKFMKVIILAHLFYVIIKLYMVVGFLVGYSQSIVAIEYFSSVLGRDLMSYGVIPKISLPNDILSALLILLILHFKSLKIRLFSILFENLLIILMFLSLIVSFNRFNLFLLFIGLIYLIIIGKKLKHLIISFFIVSFVIYIISEYSFIFESIISLWENRLGGEGSLSTNEKFFQYFLFLERIQENFLFGHGLGTFLTDYIRDENIRYGYEAFLFLIFYQFGLIMFIILLGFYFGYYFKHYYLLKNKYLSFIFILHALIFSVSIVNPMILNSMFAMIFTVTMASFMITKDKLRS